MELCLCVCSSTTSATCCDPMAQPCRLHPPLTASVLNSFLICAWHSATCALTPDSSSCSTQTCALARAHRQPQHEAGSPPAARRGAARDKLAGASRQPLVAVVCGAMRHLQPQPPQRLHQPAQPPAHLELALRPLPICGLPAVDIVQQHTLQHRHTLVIVLIVTKQQQQPHSSSDSRPRCLSSVVPAVKCDRPRHAAKGMKHWTCRIPGKQCL